MSVINTDSTDWIEIVAILKSKRESAISALLSPHTDDRAAQFYRGQAALAAELLALPDKQQRDKP